MHRGWPVFLQGAASLARVEACVQTGEGQWGGIAIVAIWGYLRSTFNLLMTKMNYDLQAFQVYKAKIASYESAISLTKTKWRRDAYLQNQKTVESFLDGCMCLACHESKDDVPVKYNTFLNTVCKRLQLDQNAVACPASCACAHTHTLTPVDTHRHPQAPTGTHSHTKAHAYTQRHPETPRDTQRHAETPRDT